jgi:hypothetical protein
MQSFLSKIFGDNMNSESKKYYYYLGLRINELCKNNKNFRKIIIKLLYNNMNESLTRLDERFSELSEDDQLVKFFDDVRNQFLELIHFSQISPDIKELYDSNSLEYKYLINLLLSLYNIIFSKNNIQKIDNKNEHYKNLLNEVNKFYNIIISNIINQNNQDILKEISKQRNILHFKEILQNLERFNPVKDGQDDKYKYFKDFMEQLEKLVPEEEVINKIDIDNNKEMTKSGRIIEINLCNICSDSVINTHLIPCDHSLCRTCFFQCLSENKSCPFCRAEIKGIKEDPNFKIN